MSMMPILMIRSNPYTQQVAKVKAVGNHTGKKLTKTQQKKYETLIEFAMSSDSTNCLNQNFTQLLQGEN